MYFGGMAEKINFSCKSSFYAFMMMMTRFIMERMAIRTKRNRSRMRRILTAFCNANKLELVESSWDVLWIKLMTTI